MTTCDTGTDRVVVDAGLGVEPTQGESTTDLVDETGDGAIWSLRRDCDAHTAAVRGLAHYLSTMSVQALGRAIRFERVTEEAADVHDEAVAYPVAAVTGDEEGVYSGPSLTPVVVSAADRDGYWHNQPVQWPIDGDLVALYTTGDYRNDRLLVEVTCDSKPERAAVMAALEDMLSPYLGRGGFALRLRHYHGAVARYLIRSQSRSQLPTDIASGAWIVRLRITVVMPVIRVHRRPYADPRVEVDVPAPPDL